MRSLVAIHVVGVVLWMGGLLNLSRILGYHAREAPSVRPRYSFLEARLNYLVTIPGAVLTLATGIAQAALLGEAGFRVARWLHIKIGLVVLIAIAHAWLTVKQRAITIGPADARLPRALFAAVHGTLGLLLIAVVFLAVLKLPVASLAP